MELCVQCHEHRSDFAKAASGTARKFSAALEVVKLASQPNLTQEVCSATYYLKFNCCNTVQIQSQSVKEILRDEGVHKRIRENPLFRDLLLGVFDPYRQIPHDSLHSDMLGIGKHMGLAARDLLTKEGKIVVNARVRVLAKRGICNIVDIGEAATWNGRDIRQFSRIAPIVLSGLDTIPALLLECFQKEAELIWYLTLPDWCTSLEQEFSATYKRQRCVDFLLSLTHCVSFLSLRHLPNVQLYVRELYAQCFMDQASINQHVICHTIAKCRTFGPPACTDSQTGEAAMGVSRDYANHTSRYSCDFAFKRQTQLFSIAIWHVYPRNYSTLILCQYFSLSGRASNCLPSGLMGSPRDILARTEYVRLCALEAVRSRLIRSGTSLRLGRRLCELACTPIFL